MSGRAAPGWLSDFQASFGSVLRAPLDRSTGTLRAEAGAYDAALCGETDDAWWGPAAACLAVYNRQYWFRLFTVMQQAFPLTTALAGAWAFNGLAARFLLDHAPAGWDIERVPDGFAGRLPALLDAPPPTPGPGASPLHAAAPPAGPLLAAAPIDEAWRRLLRAPAARPYRPTAAEAARLLTARLAPSPAVALVTERWPLLALRRSLPPGGAAAAVPLPEALPGPQDWALVRRPGGVEQVRLEPGEAALWGHLRQHSVVEALGLLEAACPEDERAALPGQVQRWLGRGVALGAWSGLRDGEPADQGSTQL